MKKKLLLFFFFSVSLTGFAQQTPLWTKINSDATSEAEKAERSTTPKEFQIYALDFTRLKSILATAPQRENSKTAAGLIIPFPTAEGSIENFRVYQNPVMHPALASRYPDIKSYMGVGIDDPTAAIYFSTTIFGLHTMTYSGKSDVNYIDTYTKDLTKYIVYAKGQLVNNGIPFECHVENRGTAGLTDTAKNPNATMSDNGVLRTYRLALSSTVEYSNFHIAQAGMGSGTLIQKKAAVLAAMNVTMVRVNGVYERDLSVHLQIIPNDDVLISIGSDSFSNNDGGSLLGENQGFIETNIGSANYDMGHIFSTGGGGVALLGSVCIEGIKAQGVTGLSSPVNDAFSIDYVAHEMGHQFGGDHTFNSDQGSCGGGNRNDPTAVEPGSGTTIMAYAGICSPHNVQNNSDAHFSFISLQEINAFLNNGGGGSCSVNTALSNTAPVIGSLTNYSIPKGTPFVLRANATDAENDPLTYCWEQNNNEISTQPPLATSTVGPNFRSRPPSASPDRYFPALNALLNNYEIVPSVPRVLNFVLTVRDNSASGPQTATGSMAVTVTGTGPFMVTSPDSAVSWPAASNQTVTWDVAGTTANGINTAFVDIYMSANAGTTYPLLLANNVPNDGSELITVPNSPGTANKIMVRARGNIFYDTSNTNFTITAPSPATTFGLAYNGMEGEQNKSACIGNDVVYTLNYNPVGGFAGTAAFNATGAPAGTSVVFSPAAPTTAGVITMTVSSTNTATAGFYPLVVTASSGAITKTTNLYLNLQGSSFNAQLLSSPADLSVGALPTGAVFTWAANSANATSYTIEIAADAAFANIAESASVSGTSYVSSGLSPTTDYYWRVLPKNDGCSGNYSVTYMFKTGYCGYYESDDIPYGISASGTPVINSTITIPAEDSSTITDVNVSINIAHTKINNISARLISPAGTEVILFANLCSPFANGFEDAVVTLDDSGTTLVCSAVLPSLSGRVMPNQPLSILNGQSSQGVWTLRVSDRANGNGGSLSSWGINFCTTQGPLAVENIKPGGSFTVFPNPGNGSFTVQSDRIQSDRITIQVYDLRGRIIFDNNYSASGTLNENIQLKNAQAGIYLLSVSDGGSKEVKRIIIE